MKSRSWMIPLLPIAAIIAGLGIVWGALAGWRSLDHQWWKYKNREGLKAVAEIQDAFEKVLPVTEWTAAGLPIGPPDDVFSLRNTTLAKDADEFTAMRSFGTAQGVYGSADLMVATQAEADHAWRGMRGKGLFPPEGITKVASGFAAGSSDEARAWYLLAREGGNPRAGDEHLFGLCFYDAAWIQINVSGPGATKHADHLRQLMQSTADRLARACETDLRPYIDRFAAQRRAQRLR